MFKKGGGGGGGRGGGGVPGCFLDFDWPNVSHMSVPEPIAMVKELEYFGLAMSRSNAQRQDWEVQHALNLQD